MISGEEHTAQRDTPMARLQRERDRRTALAHDNLRQRQGFYQEPHHPPGEVLPSSLRDGDPRCHHTAEPCGYNCYMYRGCTRRVHDHAAGGRQGLWNGTCEVVHRRPRRQSPPIPKGFSRIPVEGRSQLPHPSQRYSRADVLSRCGAAVRPRIYF